MNKQQFIDILRSPEGMSESTFSELEQLIDDNPYFHSARVIAARGSRILKKTSAGQWMNSAAIYATNRNILKQYIQGQVPFSDSQAPPVVQQKPKESKIEPTQSTPKPSTEPAPATPKASDEVALKPPSNPKSPQDYLLVELYNNLEGWKKNREAYLSAEKSFVDYQKAPDEDQSAGSNVEKIKNQIAEEVKAEEAEAHNAVSESIAKASQDQASNEASEVSEVVDEPPTEIVQDSEPAEQEAIDSEAVTNPENQTLEVDVKEEEPSSEVTVSDELPDVPEEDISDVPEIDLLEASDDTEPTNTEDEVLEEVEEEVVVALDVEQARVDNQQESETSLEETSVEEEEEITIESEIEEPSDPDLDHSTEIEIDSVDTEDSIEEPQTEAVAKKTERITIDEEVEQAPEPDNAIVAAEMDEELHHMEEEKARLKLTPAGSDKKFRLAFLRKPNKETKALSKAKKASKSAAIKKKQAAKELESTSTTKKTTKAASSSSKEKPSSAKKTTSTTKTAKKESPSKTTKKPLKKTPTRKVSMSSLAAKASKKIAEKKALKDQKEDSDSKKKKTEVKKGAQKSSNSKESSDQDELIDNFLKTNPTIKTNKVIESTAENPDLSAKSNSFPEEIATENIAEILIKQSKIEKAILVYQRLIQKNPAKQEYFQARIDALNNDSNVYAKVEKDSNLDYESLMRDFLVDNPTVIALDWASLTEIFNDLGKTKVLADFMITENLAEVLCAMGENKVAAQVYRKLVKKEPEKRAYFLEEIAKLRKK